ncbi:permease [Planctomycetales bacterium]|nr:permease [Planctomycetales bacterium]
MAQEPYNQFNDDFSAPTDLFAAAADADARSSFIVKTYLYLLGAIAALVGIEVVMFNAFDMMRLTQVMMGGQFSWLIALGLFMGVSFIANAWALNATNPGLQHAGLALYVVAQAIILAPLLCVAQNFGGEGVIMSAGLATAALFAALTLTVFLTRKDFAFLGSFLMFAGFAALGFIILSIGFSFALGPIFTYLMIAFACCYILYDTSNVLHHYRIGQHVAASLALFASVVLLFWYILQLFMSNED